MAVVGGLLAISGGLVGVAVATDTAPQCSTVNYTQNESGWNEVENVSQLQCIGANGLSEDYVLIGDIDASGTNQWNGGAGFDPIGEYGSTHSADVEFTGRFDGDGHVISGLYIDRITENYVGLFGVVEGSDAVIEDVGLENADVRGSLYVGGLVGVNEGATVRKSYATGSLAGADSNL